MSNNSEKTKKISLVLGAVAAVLGSISLLMRIFEGGEE